MRTLAWMQRTFRQNNHEKSRNVSARKSYSCFSALWELDGQQRGTETIDNSTRHRQPRVCPKSSISLQGVKELAEEEAVDLSPEFFHGFLAIGTLGSVSIISKEAITPKDAIPDVIATAKEINAAENESQCLNKKSKNQIEKEEHEVTKENKISVEYSPNEYSEMPATKEETKEQKTMSDNHFKKDATWKRSRKFNNGIKRGTHMLPFMKKMLKKLDLTSCCSTSAAGSKAIFSESTNKIPSKVFGKSRKIHPEAADLQVPKSHSYEVKKVCYDEYYDREVTFEEEDKGTVSSSMFANRPINSQPDGKKAHWIKTDADYFVLEF